MTCRHATGHTNYIMSDDNTFLCLYLCECLYVSYVDMYIERERERELKRKP